MGNARIEKGPRCKTVGSYTFHHKSLLLCLLPDSFQAETDIAIGRSDASKKL